LAQGTLVKFAAHSPFTDGNCFIIAAGLRQSLNLVKVGTLIAFL
jgi:hypothetical protein